MSAAVGADAPFVGRAEEVRRLLDGLRSAGGRGVGVALVEGEPGIGKSRLLAEVAARLQWTTVWARCWDGDGTPALWPWVQVVRALKDSAGGPGRSVESPLDRLLRGEPVGATDGAARFAVFEAITDRLVDACAAAPLLIVIDDLHWADAGSARLLRFVASDPRVRHLAVLAACRDESRTKDLDDVVVEASRFSLHLRLHGLNVDDVASIVELLGEDDRRPDVRDLHQRSGGNPLFVREFLRLPADATTVPAGVAAVVRMRVADVSTAARLALEAAAVLGQEFDLPLLMEMQGVESDSVAGAIDEAHASRLITANGSPNNFQFAHAVVREVLYGGLPMTERSRLHLLAARALERRGHRAVTEVAHHLLHGPAEARAEAATWAVKAAEHCAGVAAYEQAAEWYGHALATDVGSGAGHEAELLIRRGEACLAAGDTGDAGEAFRQACAVARQSGDAERLARAALGLGSGPGGFEVPTHDASQTALLEEALAVLGPEATAIRAAVLARLSIALTGASVEARRRELAEEAVAVARAAGDDAALGQALAAHCDVNAGPEHSEHRVDHASSIVELAQRAGDRQLALLGHRLRLVARLEVGDIPGADDDAARFAAIADQLRQPSSRWYVPLWKGMRALMAGDVATAAACTTSAEEIGARAESYNALALCFTQRWVAMRAEGRFEDAGHALRAVTGLGPGDTPIVTGPDRLRLEALVAIHLGDQARARALLEELLRSGLIERHRDSEWLPEMAQLSEIAAAVGHQPSAAVLLDALRPFSHRFCVEGIGAALIGSVNWYLARLCGTLHHDRDAERFERAAREAHRRVGLAGDPPGLVGTAATAGGTAPPAESNVASMLAEGATWAITFAGVTRRLRDSKGLRDLAVLVMRPQTEVHCLELVGGVDVGDAAGAPLDDRARTAYQQRIRDLQEDIDEARAANDPIRSERAEHELDALVEQLSAAFGLSGRARRVGSAAERARTTVTSRIRSAVRHAREIHPDLGRHLQHSIRTGTWCSYEPEHPVSWRVAAADASSVARPRTHVHSARPET